MNDTLTELYSVVDDFCQLFLPVWQRHLIENKLKKRNRQGKLRISEVITILIHFHQMRFRDFKTYYEKYVKVYLKHLFINLVSYTRFLELIKESLVPFCMFTQSLSGEHTGIYFVDSLLIKSCHIKREKQHRVFKGLAKKSKSTVGWFFGFKLHLIINDKGEFMAFKVTAANVDDRKTVPDLTKNLIGKLIGDKGYLSSNLFSELYARGLHLLTKIRNNMKNKLMPVFDKLLLRKRALIESVNDQLKNISQIEHSRHRSIFNFMANILSAIAAYAMQPKKPSIDIAHLRPALLTA
jgi:hypothetical protein